MATEKASVNSQAEDLPVLKEILDLNEPQFDSLLTAFRESKPTLTRREFTNNVSKRIKTISATRLASILRVVFILYLMKDRTGVSSRELAEAITESAVESSS